MPLQFLRGDENAPKGHAILIAHSLNKFENIYCTYCIVSPIPIALQKYIPSFLSSQISTEEIAEVSGMSAVPIPPLFESGQYLEHLRQLAEIRDDDVCDVGMLESEESMFRMQFASMCCQEYAQSYLSYIEQVLPPDETGDADQISRVSDTDLPEQDAAMIASENPFTAFSEQEKVEELTKLAGNARYALEGNDRNSLENIQETMQQLVATLPEKYKGESIVRAALQAGNEATNLTQLYLERCYKLLQEEYSAIPDLDQEIQKMKEQE